MKRTFIAAALAFATMTLSAQAQPVAGLQQIGIFNTPVYVTGAPGASSGTLLFVVELAGVIRVLDNHVAETNPFLDISARVASGGERGLLSIAFDPDYETNRLFYVAFTNLKGDVEINEFKRHPSNPKRVDPTSRRRVLAIAHREAGNHNGGQVQFGPDGFLYISVGDGGEVFPRGKYARNLKSLLGKILRIDPTPQGAQPYTIPPDNPFVGIANRRGEIFAYGLRNPWRFSFDGNRIAIADVGQVEQEELNFLRLRDAKGVNFGWPQFEGKNLFDNTQPGPTPAKFPMYVYRHSNGACAIIGGYIWRDPAVPELRNKYLFGDLCTGRIFSLVPDVQAQKATDVRYIGVTATNLSSFGIGPQNRIYITQTSGQLSRIREPE
jgi:glucose/arabinose dehydrogenase